MEETELTFAQLYADLVEASKQTLPENYFTLKDFVADSGLKPIRAQRILAEQVDAGKLQRREKVVINGHAQTIYWFAEKA